MAAGPRRQAPAFWYAPPGLAANLLTPLGFLYGAATLWRMRRRGVRAAIPVIVVGNPTLGGAGKTPTALALAKLLQEQQESVFFLSRGYGGTTPGPVRVDTAVHTAQVIGDEALLLARAAPTVVAADRAAGARLAAAQGASLVLLDDGLQNPSLIKDLSLMVVDTKMSIGNGRMFPAGPLRAPLDGQMARVQGLVAIGAPPLAPSVAALASRYQVRIFSARLVPDRTAAAALRGLRVLAFTGIGRPTKFFDSLREIGTEIVDRWTFPDHHAFTAAEARRLLAAADRNRLIPVTTEKDHVRLTGDPALVELAARSRVLPVELVFEEPEAVRALLTEALRRRRRDDGVSA